MVSVSAGSIAIYNLPESKKRTEIQRMNEINLAENDHKGKVSAKAKRRISKAIDWMLYLAKDKELYPHKPSNKMTFRLNMVTLTLCSKQIHSDNEIKSKLLNQFLVEMRSVWKCEHYLWRAEAQGNGNIHFHIITDKFIPWNELRNRWNRIQNKLGYVDKFEAKHRKRTPNSTDIHSIWKVKNLSAYLAKYCTKEDKNRKIEGKQWGLSNSLSKMKGVSTERWSKLEDDLHKVFKTFKKKVRTYDYATVIYVKIEEWKKIGCSYLANLIDEQLGKAVVVAPPPVTRAAATPILARPAARLARQMMFDFPPLRSGY